MILDYVSNSSGFPLEQQVSQNFTSELQWSSAFFISIVLNGSLHIHYKNHTHEFHTHDIFFFPPFETYSVSSSVPGTRVLSIKVDSEYINKLCPDVARLTMQQHHISFDLNNSIYCRICRNFSTIIFNNLKNEVSSRLKLLQAANDIMITIFDTYGMKSETEAAPEYSRERMIKILQYMNANYHQKLLVTDISAFLGIHPQYFSSFFQKNFHVGFVEYLNTYRVNHSMAELLYTDHSILEIAINHGFSNHKTYAAAFRRLYSVSPTGYKKQFHSDDTASSHKIKKENASSNDGTFSYFRQFLQSDNHTLPTRHYLQNQQPLELNTFALKKSIRINQQERFLSVGRAYACLRSEIQTQIRNTKKNYDVNHLRIRDIFSDDLYIYYEPDGSHPVYNWNSLDSVFDFILSLDARPFPEIGYMPSCLASKKQYANWQYHPNVSHPKSLKKWSELIKRFLTHLIDRYGMQEVRSWYFDFWTNPDLELKNPYWYEDQTSFFEFYLVTYQAFLEIDPQLRLGSPNFSTINGLPWYEAFFAFCREHHITPAYISAHLYGCEGNYSRDLGRGYNNYSITNQLLVPEHIQKIRSIMDESGFDNSGIIVSDWNLSFLPTDLVRDTCYMGPYICHTFNHSLFQLKGLSFWSLSDNYEDFFPDTKLFQGGPGMLDYHGLKKAAYNTVSLLGMLGDQILSRGENYIFTKKNEEYQLLLYNLAKFDYMYSIIDQSAIDATHRYNIYSNTENRMFQISIKLPRGTWYIKKYEVNRQYGSAYDIWGQIGFPPVLSKDIEDYIRESSVPHISYSYQDIEHTLLLDESVPAHGILLLKIIPK